MKNQKPHVTLSNEKGDSVSFFYEKEKDLKEALRKAHIPLDEFNSSPPEKIKMESITFEYGEGYATTEFPISFTTWEEANNFLWQRSFQEGYYLKHDFVIKYDDGKKYSGTFDLYTRESGEKVRADLGAHVMSHNLFYSGRQSPSHMNEESVKGILAGTKREDKEACARFLDRYEIKVKNLSNIFYC